MDNTNAQLLINGEANTPEAFTQQKASEEVSEQLAQKESELEQKEQELQKLEFKVSAKETLIEKGLPANLLDAFNTSSPEAFKKSLELLEPFIQQNKRLQQFNLKATPKGYLRKKAIQWMQ